MKRIISILLTISLLASALMCLVSCKFEKDDDDRTSSKKDKKHSYISQEQKNTWHDKLYALLLKSDIHDSELGLLGSYAAGLMDFDFDNTPELVLAYHGGSMGNLPLEIYDINTGEKLADYDSSIYNENNTACIYVAQKDSEYVILSETAFRIPPLDSASFISTISADKDSDFIKSTNLFYKETFDNETSTIYKHLGQSVDKDEYDEKHQQFLEDYKKIDGTQLQLFQWSTFGKLEWTDLGEKEGVDPESRQDLVKKMTFALLHSSQKFIQNKNTESDSSESTIEETTESFTNNSSFKEDTTHIEETTSVPEELDDEYLDVPKEYRPILKAYKKMASYKNESNLITQSDAKDYPELNEEQFTYLRYFTGDYNSYGMGYFLYDINLDGTDELIFSHLEGRYIYLIFTSDGINANIVGAFDDTPYNYDTQIGDDGKIHVWVMGKGEGYTKNIITFYKDGSRETVSYSFSDYADVDGNIQRWLIYENGEWVDITEEEFMILEENYAFNEIDKTFDFHYFFEFSPK